MQVQTEFHVFVQNRGVLEWCQARSVVTIAYGTLGGSTMVRGHIIVHARATICR